MAIESLDILVACGSKSWGGLEIMALDSAIQLKKRGFRIHVFCPDGSQLHRQAIDNNINTISYNSQSGTISRITKLRKYLLGNDIDIVHTHLSHDLWTVVPALKMSQSKALLFLTRHIASGVNKKDMMHKYLYKRVNKIIAVSSFIRNNVLDTCPVTEEKVILLQNGIDTKIFNKSGYSRNDIRNEFNIGTDKTVIGLIGRITPGKGHTEFIKAAEIVNRFYPETTLFLVVGSSEKGEENVEIYIRKLANEKMVTNIIFTGYRADVAKLLSGIDILTFPSHEESFGMTLLEAMAMEVPVIASRSAGITDIIPSDEYGILVPPKDHEKLADEIMRLMKDKELMKKLGENGKKRITDNFDVEIKTKELVELYQRELQSIKNMNI